MFTLNGDCVQVIPPRRDPPQPRLVELRGHRDENISRGTEMLERELGRDGFDALLHGKAMAKVAKCCNLVGTEDLLASEAAAPGAQQWAERHLDSRRRRQAHQHHEPNPHPADVLDICRMGIG